MNKSRELAHIEAMSQNIMQQLHVADIVMVQSYDAGTNRATVKPLVQRMVNGVAVSLPPILSVPVIQPVIPINPAPESGSEPQPQLSAGDIGVVLYLDTDCDIAITTGAEGAANTSRAHSVDDAVFLGVIKRGGQ